MKVNLYISDLAWDCLIQMGFNLHYIRGGQPNDRPRGMSAFVSMLAWHQFSDARPDMYRGTGQWSQADEPFKQRCLRLDAPVLAQLGLQALEHGIFPYKTQRPVIDGYRREAIPPVLHAVGATPLGSTSVRALAGPFLEAVGRGYLVPLATLPEAPPDLYQGPSRRDELRRRRRTVARDVA